MAQGSGSDAPPQDVLHATTVNIDGKGVMIIGKSGAGKSSLALELMTLGAKLVADDRTIVKRNGETLQASVPPSIKGKIEARGIGILKIQDAGPTNVVLVVDLDKTSDYRLPEPRTHEVLGIMVDCLHRVPHAHFVASILFYVKGITYPQHDGRT